MYTLCGLGAACSIAEGKPTVARGALLRREALELALYTFHYIDGIDSVLVLLPPRPTDRRPRRSSSSAATFAPSWQAGSKRRSRRRSTPGVGEMPEDERRVIDRTTRSRLYGYSYLQAQDGSPLMVLTPAIARWLMPRARRCARAREGQARPARLLPEPVRIERVRILVAPWFFRIPGFRRYSGYALWRTILLKRPPRPTTSSRTSSATSGRGSIAPCT